MKRSITGVMLALSLYSGCAFADEVQAINTVDSITNSFLKEIKRSVDDNEYPVVLEVGAGYGSASLEAMKHGAFIWVNEMNAEKLKTISARVPQELVESYKPVLGDFVSNAKLPKSAFDAVLAARVIEYIAPERLQASVGKMYEVLQKGGRVYIIADSPYSKPYEHYTPEYESKLQRGLKNPGYTNAIGEDVGAKINLMEPLQLYRVFNDVGFNIEYCDYLSTDPEDTHYKTIGIIARK